jgi:hypothetical protein
MAERKTEKINVWLTPEQVAWLKTKKNVSETVRAMVTEGMSIDALAQSVQKKPAAATKKPADPTKKAAAKKPAAKKK